MGCHHDEAKGDHKGKQCFLHLHDDLSYGLGRKDRYELFGGDKVAIRNSWKSPTVDELKAHAAHIERIQQPPSRYTLRSGRGCALIDDNNDNNNNNNENSNNTD